tara:strand:+ start:538 stop:702 length:165 start_codon:yes stop_codon:yes gene_type:complete
MTPFAKRVVVKTEISPEVKLKLQKLAIENKRSMRKQLEYIIEKAIEDEYGKENN